MVAKKPRIVIIGAGMAGLTAANKLYKSPTSKELFELCVVEGGDRIGGRINTSEFGGDQIEMGATWIHGIGGSPIHKIAQEINSLESEQNWECMDEVSVDERVTSAEGGYELNPSLVERVSTLFNELMNYAQGKVKKEGSCCSIKLAAAAAAAKDFSKACTTTNNNGLEQFSLGSFLRQGLEIYWDSAKDQEELEGYCGNWSRKELEDAIFAMHESTQRTYTSAGDLLSLDYSAESEYRLFPGEEISIAKGYLSIIESLASVLPEGSIQLGRKVTRIEWQPDGSHHHQQQPLADEIQNGHPTRPVKLYFSDGSTMSADHVVVTVSLGVLKAGIRQDSGLFSPPLPSFKTWAISRLGYGVVNKLFLQLSPENCQKFPSLQMVFHQSDPKLRNPNIPWWMRRTASITPIYSKSSVLLSWFAGKEALELESLNDKEIIDGVSETISCFLCQEKSDHHQSCNGNAKSVKSHIPPWSERGGVKIAKVLKSQWGTDPLFFGSYSYVAVGSSGDDMDTMAEPLPTLRNSCCNGSSSNSSSPPLQILFAGEATHRFHYSTTHGAYFSGLREANRLLEHYQCAGAGV